jgi:hypothetical protein
MVFAGLTVCTPTFAAKTVYKCTKDGQVTLTDQPCDTASTSASSSLSATAPSAGTTISSSTNPSPVGDWRGQIQYQGRESGQTLTQAHSVAPLAVNFTADGKVSGGSADNECKWLGVWSQGDELFL